MNDPIIAYMRIIDAHSSLVSDWVIRGELCVMWADREGRWHTARNPMELERQMSSGSEG